MKVYAVDVAFIALPALYQPPDNENKKNTRVILLSAQALNRARTRTKKSASKYFAIEKRHLHDSKWYRGSSRAEE